MKTLLIIIALLVLGIAPASASELDGKYLKCPVTFNTPAQAPLYILFGNPDKSAPKISKNNRFDKYNQYKVSYIQIIGSQFQYVDFGTYELMGIHKIEIKLNGEVFLHGKIGEKIVDKIMIDRTTLTISDGVWSLGICSISSKQKAELEIKSYIKQGMKKNKF